VIARRGENSIVWKWPCSPSFKHLSIHPVHESSGVRGTKATADARFLQLRRLGGDWSGGFGPTLDVQLQSVETCGAETAVGTGRLSSWNPRGQNPNANARCESLVECDLPNTHTLLYATFIAGRTTQYCRSNTLREGHENRVVIAVSKAKALRHVMLYYALL
jgi:hypothetical protein